MIAGDGVTDQSEPELIEPAPPALASHISAQRDRLIDFRVGERFALAFIPTPAPEDARLAAQLLLEIDSNAVFDSPLTAMRLNVGDGLMARQERVNSIAVAPHIGVIDVGEQTHASRGLR